MMFQYIGPKRDMLFSITGLHHIALNISLSVGVQFSVCVCESQCLLTQLFQHLITLIQDEVFDVFQVKALVARQR